MNALDYARQLVRFESTSNLSNLPISDYVEQTLQGLGFDTERIEFDDEFGIGKASVVAKLGSGTGGMAYFGHTDVVPADDWKSADTGPFTPTVKAGRLYGRGSCDMKGSLACMLAAVERHASADLKAPIYVTCTADEEVGYGGAKQVVEKSQLYREMVAGQSYGIVGEPTLLEVVYAHKGTYGFTATSRGRAAHSSTREGINANLAMIPFLQAMKEIHDQCESESAWQNNEFDPPTITWNIGINDHTRAINITAPQSICTVYFRPMPGQEPRILLDKARRAAEACGIEFHVDRQCGPLYVDPASSYVQELLRLAGKDIPRTVAYGTDGGILTEMENLVVLGPGDIAQAHTADEWIALEQLEKGTEMFAKLIRTWCC